MIRTFFKATAVAALTVVSASAANAQTGFINLVGQLQPSSTPGATTPLNIDILSGGSFPPTVTGFGTAGNVFAGTSTGFFAGLTGMMGTMNDIQINGGGTSVTTLPMTADNQLLQIGTYRFTFGPIIPATGGTLAFGPITLEDTPTFADARINLRPIITGGVCVPFCTAEGGITAQFAQYAGTGGSVRLFNDINSGAVITPVTFSANFTASVVPEPSTYALLATGIGALAMVARRRRVQA
jgi:hypothetical protein